MGDKLLRVREFDTITCNDDYKNEYKYLSEDVFENVEQFIREYTSSDGGAEALDFLKVGYRKRVGKTISVNNYVGLIEVKGGHQIEVLPKIDFSDDFSSVEDADAETKRIFLKMLKTMKDFPGKSFNMASLDMSKMSLYEIFISMYIQEVRRLLRQGIKSSNLSQNDNLNYYKGKLDITNHIKSNLVHKERFYMIFDEYVVDRPENRIVKATLEKLRRISTSLDNQKEINKQLISFEFVNSSVNYQRDFSKIIIDRTTEQYRMLIEWSKIFLFNKSFTSFSGDNQSRALLFPMEKVYESYVAKNMKRVFGDEGWNVSAQDSKYYLFDEPKKFALRPDIVVNASGKTIVMDTKWKKLIDDPSANYGISQSDMYQMYAYAKKYHTTEIYLLYPMNKEMGDRRDISYTSEDKVHVYVYFVDVSKIDESLGELKGIIKEKMERIFY